MKTTIITVICILGLAIQAKCQFYFQDIYNTRQAIANLAQLRSNKVKTQFVRSMDANQETDNDFRCERMLSPTYHQMRAITSSRSTGYTSMTSSFSQKGWLTKTVDSSSSSVTVTLYRYDTKGNLLSVSSNSLALDSKMRFDETRNYNYDSLGHLVSMVQKKGMGGDSTVVTFKTDSAGNVIEEQMRGKRTYYNYDPQGHLTDVYRYQPAKKRMLPDYIFEYDAQQRLSKMTTVNTETSSYTIWQYSYQQNGLPLKEMCYGKGNELLGIVQYNYTYNQ
ncbi:hypothetical protein [Chitinophaga vietnamensis]|uniref:hypothetical protein n=1 Tax=Chitinophaga vietnamensis TaxID=2593957 RepID=UPI00117786C5|nr:hypothetical protein [Chitinophaga vietnamensis]